MSPGTTVSVNEFCHFCIDGLGTEMAVPISVLALLNTSNNVVKVPKLVSVLKVIQPLILLSPDAEDTPTVHQVQDIMSTNRGGSVLEELAEVLDMEAIDLHADLARGGPAIVLQQLKDLLNKVSKSHCMHTVQDIKLPQGVNAPYVPARKGSSLLGFQVPVWSLRAVHQSKAEATPRGGGLQIC